MNEDSLGINKPLKEYAAGEVMVPQARHLLCILRLLQHRFTMSSAQHARLEDTILPALMGDAEQQARGSTALPAHRFTLMLSDN